VATVARCLCGDVVVRFSGRQNTVVAGGTRAHGYAHMIEAGTNEGLGAMAGIAGLLRRNMLGRLQDIVASNA
jgi:hypothetical protein